MRGHNARQGRHCTLLQETLWVFAGVRIFSGTSVECGRQETSHVQRIPLMPDLQSAWLLLLHCAGARATFFFLRVVNPEAALDYATLHNERMCAGTFLPMRLCGEAVREAPFRAWWSGFEKCSSNKTPCFGLVGRLPPHDQSTPSRSG